jgi:hypothetical protein
MKIMLRWMRERQKLRLICDHDGPHKQFLYTEAQAGARGQSGEASHLPFHF